jgi:hypothetical protein
MKFLTHAQTAELLANEAASTRGEGHDPRPIVELFARSRTQRGEYAAAARSAGGISV